MNLTYCTQCLIGFLGANQLCGDCPLKYYSNNPTKTCDKCPYDCFSCDGSKNCLTCSPSDFRELSNSRCIPMNGRYDDGVSLVTLACLSSCSSCNSPNSCINCKSGYFLYVNQCLSSCPVRYFPNILSLKC